MGKHGADVLVYYLPFHFYRKGIWGVYLRAKGILELAAELKGGPITHGSDAAVQAAKVSLFEHELFHCLTETAATRAEVVARSPIYRGYFDDRYASGHQQAMANAFAHRKIGKAYPSFISPLESWMGGQGPRLSGFPPVCWKVAWQGQTYLQSTYSPLYSAERTPAIKAAV